MVTSSLEHYDVVVGERLGKWKLGKVRGKNRKCHVKVFCFERIFLHAILLKPTGLLQVGRAWPVKGSIVREQGGEGRRAASSPTQQTS